MQTAADFLPPSLLASNKAELKVLRRDNVVETPDGAFKCLLCSGRRLANMGSVRSHFRDMHFDDGNCYLCSMCGSFHKTRNGFLNHLSLKHRGIKMKGANIDECKVPKWHHPSLLATNSDQLKELMDENVAKTPTAFECVLCDGRSLANMNSVRTHFLDMHFDDGQCYRCPMCESFHKTKNTFRNHLSVKHRGVTGVNVDECKVPKPENC